MRQYGVYFVWAPAVFRRFVKAVTFNWLMTFSQAGKTIFRRKTVPDAQRQRGQLINQSRQRHARDKNQLSEIRGSHCFNLSCRI